MDPAFARFLHLKSKALLLTYMAENIKFHFMYQLLMNREIPDPRTNFSFWRSLREALHFVRTCGIPYRYRMHLLRKNDDLYEWLSLCLAFLESSFLFHILVEEISYRFVRMVSCCYLYEHQLYLKEIAMALESYVATDTCVGWKSDERVHFEQLDCTTRSKGISILLASDFFSFVKTLEAKPKGDNCRDQDFVLTTFKRK